MKDYTDILATEEAIFKRAFYEVLHENGASNPFLNTRNLKLLQQFLDAFPKCDFQLIEWVFSEETKSTDKPMKRSSANLPQICRSPELSKTEKLVLSGLFSIVISMIETSKELPQDKYKYSDEMEIFLSCCKSYNADSELFNSTTDLIQICKYPKLSYHHQLKIDFISFLLKLHTQLKEPKTRKQILDKRAGVHKTCVEMKDYVNALIKNTGKLGVLKINLSYSNPDITFEAAQKDITRFYSNKRHNKLFKAQNGFITNVEYTPKTGFYFQVLLFFNCNELDRNFDISLGIDVTSFWYELIRRTSDRKLGTCFAKPIDKIDNNYTKPINEINNVFIISAEDTEVIKDLLDFIEYLKKKELFVKPSLPPKTQLMRKGTIKTKPLSVKT